MCHREHHFLLLQLLLLVSSRRFYRCCYKRLFTLEQTWHLLSLLFFASYFHFREWMTQVQTGDQGGTFKAFCGSAIAKSINQISKGWTKDQSLVCAPAGLSQSKNLKDCLSPDELVGLPLPLIRPAPSTGSSTHESPFLVWFSSG